MAIRVKERSGSYFLRVSVKGQSFNLTMGAVGNLADKAKAEFIAHQAQQDIKAGRFTGFDAYTDSYSLPTTLEIIEKLSKHEGHNYQAVKTKLESYGKQIRNGRELQAFFETLNVSEPTKARYLSCIRKAYPSALWDGLSFSQSKGAPDPFTKQELTAILEFKETLLETQILQFWSAHGLRTGEMAALSISDIDFDEGWITIRHSWDSKKHSKKDTKTGVVRRVPLAVPKCFFETFLETSSPFSPLRNISNFVRDHWAPRLDELGIRYRSPYKLRHTWISRQLKEQQGDVVKVARWAGNSPQAIWKNYAGYLD